MPQSSDDVTKKKNRIRWDRDDWEFESRFACNAWLCAVVSFLLIIKNSFLSPLGRKSSGFSLDISRWIHHILTSCNNNNNNKYSITTSNSTNSFLFQLIASLERKMKIVLFFLSHRSNFLAVITARVCAIFVASLRIVNKMNRQHFCVQFQNKKKKSINDGKFHDNILLAVVLAIWKEVAVGHAFRKIAMIQEISEVDLRHENEVVKTRQG